MKGSEWSGVLRGCLGLPGNQPEGLDRLATSTRILNCISPRNSQYTESIWISRDRSSPRMGQRAGAKGSWVTTPRAKSYKLCTTVDSRKLTPLHRALNSCYVH